MKTLFLLFLLWGVYLIPTNKLPNSQADAAKAFDQLVKFNAKPIQANQVKRLKLAGFKAWLKDSKNINEATKKDFFKKMSPAMANNQFDATLFQAVPRNDNQPLQNIILVKVPQPFVKDFGTRLYFVYETIKTNNGEEDDNEIESCEVSSCDGEPPFCCLKGVSFGDDCAQECSDDASCGSGCGKQEGPLQIMETLFY